MIVQILWFLTWPLLIFVSYRLVLYALKRQEKHLKTEEE